MSEPIKQTWRDRALELINQAELGQELRSLKNGEFRINIDVLSERTVTFRRGNVHAAIKSPEICQAFLDRLRFFEDQRLRAYDDRDAKYIERVLML
jgi:hypothetical protein